MSVWADLSLVLILAGLTAYLLFGGADFGAGLWHLLGRERRLIEHAMGPVWEANHVWLIFVMVLTWTAFPPVFAGITEAYWVPLSIAALGIVARGSALAFRKVVPEKYAVTFALSSLATPFCLGAVAGAVALGRRNWLSLPALYVGVLTVGLCVYLAAVYLTWDAHREGDATRFRAYALRAGCAVGLLALPGAAITGVHSPLIGVSAVAGVASLLLLWRRHYLAVRVTAALATAAVLWGAAATADLPLASSAAPDAVLRLVLTVLAIGGLLLVPSLTWLYVLFQRQEPDRAESTRA
ncbi:cytochrome d ubiquinol oxidase subunit II [Actinoallomurus purpureus]|uniref:cytochrome d ubiquinol oxidase subunit II n=1 Tax=Actinoallomurus purpureus TaxID=478114 RepID=UPI0020928F16|nr:cytochrome d ubiquinol oxidase subunit II [Actinoallomurus purpureus]MCO6010842.1 cytochrome d ubiquinol oxidase subunit II [Actinoallomurus purpureus]